MWIDKRKLKNGDVYYSFSYLDETTGKRVRLKKNQHPVFTKREDTEAWARSQLAYREYQKTLIAKKTEWRTKYYEFGDLAEKYAKFQKKMAPIHGRQNVVFLEYYVFSWFLDVKRQDNLNAWYM